MIVAAENLGKRYGDRWLFRRVEFELSKGDCLAVVGPNGSGKSTLAKIVAGLLPASEGKVRLEGELGYAGVELAMYPLLTIEEHLRLAADLRGGAPRSEELLAWCGLSEARNRPSGQLSTGMKARLRLCLAIQHEPSLLILDEPGASLDEQGHALVQEAIQGQLSRGAVILATNDPVERAFGTFELAIGGRP